MIRIVVSYRRDDASGHAGRLCDALASRFGRESVFMDIDAVDLGVDFVETIEGAVRSCDVLIALIGPNWLTATDADGGRRIDQPDDFVRLELETALASDRVLLIPACVRGAALPSADELPPSLAPLVRRQAIELRDVGWHDDVGRLIRRLERLDDEPRESVTAPKRRPRGRLVAAGAAGAAVLAAAAVLYGTSGGGEESGSPESRLQSLIPVDLEQRGCERRDRGPAGSLATLECTGMEGVSVIYHLFASTEDMDRWYAGRRVAVDPDTGSCDRGADFEPRGEASFSGGHVLCFLDGDGEPQLFWTDDRHHVGSEASRYGASGDDVNERFLELWRDAFTIRS